MPPQTSILLLKTKSTPQDGYDDFFSANNYLPCFIPVLEHRFHAENLARVRDLFASGAFDSDPRTDNADAHTDHPADNTNPGKKYGGMIFTSQRAVEAFVKMIEEDGLPNTLVSPNIPLYTVGPATARSLTSLRDKYLPTATIHGADAGNGEKLARYILEHYNSIYPSTTSPQTSTQRETQTETETETETKTETETERKNQNQNQNQKPALLFLVGEQRRDIIPKTLMSSSLPEAERITVDEVVVYETGEMDSFEADFAAAVRRYDHDQEQGGVLWVVVFSPTGCEGMLRGLGLGPFSSSSGANGNGNGDGDVNGKRKVFVATIGPTTRDYLRKTFGFEADVCAERPSPDGVGEGIVRFMDGLAK